MKLYFQLIFGLNLLLTRPSFGLSPSVKGKSNIPSSIYYYSDSANLINVFDFTVTIWFNLNY